MSKISMPIAAVATGRLTYKYYLLWNRDLAGSN